MAPGFTFPAECPQCHVEGGLPYKAQTKPGATLIDLRCGDCGHQWQIEMPVQSVTVMPKADRRKTEDSP